MSRSSTLILLGVLVMLVPFSGLPITLRTILSVLFGAVVLGIGLLTRQELVRAKRVEMPTETPPAAVSAAEPEPAPPSSPHGVSPI